MEENSERAFEMSTKGLDQILKGLKKPPQIRVGILGAKDERSGTANSNATVGAAHEFGTSKVPMRSFLRIPLAEHLDEYLKKTNVFDPAQFRKVLQDGSILTWARTIAVTAEAVVSDAFETAGFGKWKALTAATSARKKNDQILVETQQLRNSITSEVKE